MRVSKPRRGDTATYLSASLLAASTRQRATSVAPLRRQKRGKVDPRAGWRIRRARELHDIEAARVLGKAPTDATKATRTTLET